MKQGKKILSVLVVLLLVMGLFPAKSGVAQGSIVIGVQAYQLVYGTPGTTYYSITLLSDTTTVFNPVLEWIGESPEVKIDFFGGQICHTLVLTTTQNTNAGTYTFFISSGEYVSTTRTLVIERAQFTGLKTATANVGANLVTTNATMGLPPLPQEASYSAIGTIESELPGFISSHSVSGTTLTFSTTSKDLGTSAVITIPVTGARNFHDYSITVTISALKTIPDKPSATIDFLSERLIGLEANVGYTINERDHISNADGSIAIDIIWFGNSIDISQSETGITLRSPAQNIHIPTRPAAPSNITTIDSTKGSNDGAIIGIRSGMELRPLGSDHWTEVVGYDVPNLPAGIYLVRYMATENTFASDYTMVVINERPAGNNDQSNGNGQNNGNQGTGNQNGSNNNGSNLDNNAYQNNDYQHNLGNQEDNVDQTNNINHDSNRYQANDDNQYFVYEHFGVWSGTGDIVARVNADPHTFERLLVNGIEISSEHYEITTGSTIITLRQSILNTKGAGTHHIRAEFSTGNHAYITLTIEGSSNVTRLNPTNAPDTGDELHQLILYTVVMLVTGVLIVGLIEWKRRRELKESELERNR